MRADGKEVRSPVLGVVVPSGWTQNLGTVGLPVNEVSGEGDCLPRAPSLLATMKVGGGGGHYWLDRSGPSGGLGRSSYVDGEYMDRRAIPDRSKREKCILHM